MELRFKLSFTEAELAKARAENARLTADDAVILKNWQNKYDELNDVFKKVVERTSVGNPFPLGTQPDKPPAAKSPDAGATP